MGKQKCHPDCGVGKDRQYGSYRVAPKHHIFGTVQDKMKQIYQIVPTVTGNKDHVVVFI